MSKENQPLPRPALSRLPRLAGAAAASLLVALPAFAGPSAVSINLCADQLLVPLADPVQILGLSPFAQDPLRSSIAREAARFPRLAGAAEEVLVLKPDIVLAGRYTKGATLRMLRDHGLRVVALEVVRSVEEARAQIREVGGLLGQPERAEAAVARIDAAVSRARAAASARPFTVLPLQRRGWVAGSDTLTTSLLELVGLRNAGAALTPDSGGRVSLEIVVELRPDLLLVTNEDRPAEDQGTALLHHPALGALYPPERRLVLPGGFAALCGGPALADGIDRLADAIERR